MTRMLVRQLGPGVLLILLASSVLLISDPRRKRRNAGVDRIKRVALINYISVPVLEDGEAGMIEGLREAGFVDGETIQLRRYNAEGDRSTALMVAKEVVGGDFDAVLTLSTPVLQAVAGANTNTRMTHVFTLTTDPWGAGVGIDRDNPSIHPPYMTGQGTLQPVEALFDLALKANPTLRRVGVVWNPAEANSEASTKMARLACKARGIELLEVTVDSSAGVLDAVKSLLNRDVQAIWAGGDSTVAAALDSMIAAAQDGGVPVFTNMPSDVKQGALFSLGADYFEVGRAGGLLAAKVLNGLAPSDVPVENFVPEQLAINRVALKDFADAWSFPSEWSQQAKVIVDDQGVHEAQRTDAVRARSPAKGHVYHVDIVNFAPNEVSDVTIKGLKEKLAERGFIEGKNITYRVLHAQGEMALIPPIMQDADLSESDLVVSLTTPCLTSAASIIKSKPVVFTEVYDPIAAGAGTSASNHLPNLTGVGSFPPVEDMIDTMQAIVPGLKSIGIVYNDAEANSRKAVEVARKLVGDRGLVLQEATVSNTNEVLQAAQSLAIKNVDVLWEIGDNTVNQALESLIKVGNSSRIPVVNSDADSALRGATAGVGISFYQSGVAAGDIAADVLLGADPGKIPFEELAVVQRAANLAAAKSLGLRFSDDFLARCSVFHGVRSEYGRAAKVAFVQLSDGVALDEAQRGVIEGLAAAGLSDGKDLDLEILNAQGDLSQLSQIFDKVKSSSADLVITSTTPAMIAAARSIESIPIVFTVASEPSAVNLGNGDKPRRNLIGVYDNPPIGKLLDLAERREGRIQAVGTIWNPAEPNSEISVQRLRDECRQRGYELIERNASATNELRNVTTAICQLPIDLLVISADNVTSSGFPAIESVARQQGIPIYSTEPDLVAEGATAAIGISYYDWGRQTARLAAQILAGRNPARMQSEEVASIKTVTQ